MSGKEKKLGSFLDSVQHISIPHQERKNQPLLMLLCNVLAISLESTLSQFSPKIKIGQNPQEKVVTKFSMSKRLFFYANYGENGLLLCKTNASDTERFIFLLNQMYKWLTLLHNHFIPSMRITSKERITGKIHKTYDTPKTPYQRVLYYMPERRRKERFIQYNNSLNPFEIKAQITLYRNKIIKLLSQLEQ